MKDGLMLNLRYAMFPIICVRNAIRTEITWTCYYYYDVVNDYYWPMVIIEPDTFEFQVENYKFVFFIFILR